MCGSSSRIPPSWLKKKDLELELVLKSSLLGEIRASRKVSDLRKPWKPLATYLTLIRSYLAKGKAKAALAVYKQALQFYGRDPAFLNDFAWFLLTEKRLPKEDRDLSLALEAARKAVRLDGGMNASSLDTLALALFENGRLREALAVQEKAVALQPGDPGMRRRLERFRRALAARKEGASRR